MKTPSFLLGLAILVLAGCSTVDSRISGNQTLFNSYAPQEQELIRNGQVAVGFTPEQVQMALGKPDRVISRTAQAGSFEIWSYRDRGPRFGIGLGFGSFGHHSGMGGGVSMNTGDSYPDEKLRVIFDQSGRVASVEQVRRGR